LAARQQSPVIEFAAITGWRIASEVLPLEWRNVNFSAGEVQLDAGSRRRRPSRPRRMSSSSGPRFDAFVERYNHDRPHQALAMKAPGNVYTRSARVYRGLDELT